MDPVFAMTLRAALALLLGSAAGHKLQDLSRFRLTLQAYELLPDAAIGPVAFAVVVAELGLALAALLGIAPALTAAGAATLLTAYAAAIATNVVRGRVDIDCGCAGPASRIPLSSGLVVRNLLLACAAALLAIPVSPRALVWVDALTVSGALAALAACWLASERLLALAPAMARLRAS